MDIIFLSAGILISFILFIFIFMVLKKKSTSTLSLSKKSPSSNGRLKELEKLLAENKNLSARLAFLEEKCLVLDIRVGALTEANLELEKQRDYLLKQHKKLEELQDRKNDLMTMVVHDIKNPAAAIQNFVQLLESYDLNAVEQQDLMKNLLSTSNKILRLAEEVTQLVGLEEQLLKLNLQKYSINKTIETVKQRFDFTAKQKQILLSLDLDYEIPEIEFDPDKIDEVVDNLISNAIKFAPKETEIKIVSEQSKDVVSVKVIDNGYGLPSAELERAFEKGVKLSRKPTGGESSSGFGLWIVKRIVEEHNGKVWAESNDGYGSTFAFELPAKI